MSKAINQAPEPQLRVGTLRQQTALCDADTRVILVIDGVPASGYRVVRAYPNTVDEHKNWNATFWIEIEKREEKL